MWPVLFHLPFGLPLYAYGAMLCLSVAVGRIMAVRAAARAGLDPRLMDRACRRRWGSKREVEHLIASRNPKPDVAATIRKLPAPPAAVAKVAQTAVIAPSDARASAVVAPPEPADGPDAPRSLAAVTVLAPERYKVQLTISRETYDKVRRVQDLLRHTNPNADLADIFTRAVTVLLSQLESRRCAATASARSNSCGTTESRSRHIPAAVKREVWRRDEAQCAFVGTTGRCTETGFLEFHHVQPYAAGGVATVENIQLRCRAHNAFEVSLFFGLGGHGLVREARPAWVGCVGTDATLC